MFSVFRRSCRQILWFAFWMCLAGCTPIDNYFLGKDNTLPPTKLPPLTSRVIFKPLWQESLRGKVASVHENLVVATQHGVVYAAVSNGQVQARALQSGRLRWLHTLSKGVVSGPVVGGGTVLLGTRASTLVALNQQDGQLKWEKPLSGEALSEPLIAHGTVFVKTVDGHVYAFALNNGKQLWHVQHGSPELILKAGSSPVMGANHLLLIGFADGKLVAIQADSGQVLWEKGIGFATGASDIERLVDIDADPIFYHHSILIGTYQGFVGRLSLETGDLIWQQTCSIYKDMLLHEERLYAADASDVVWALASETGQQVWKQTHLQGRGLTSPVWTLYGLIVGDQAGVLHVLSPQDGSMIGRVELNSAVIGRPVVRGQQVVVLTQSGHLMAFRLQRQGAK